jgi:hypothetical protein
MEPRVWPTAGPMINSAIPIIIPPRTRWMGFAFTLSYALQVICLHFQIVELT